MIGAGTLPGGVGNIAAWIASAQHLKPGNAMKSYDRLEGPQLRALADYLGVPEVSSPLTGLRCTLAEGCGRVLTPEIRMRASLCCGVIRPGYARQISFSPRKPFVDNTVRPNSE